jgi:hypothetical protein
VVLHSWVLADLPSEGFHVKGLSAFDVVGRYFEMYYFTGHTHQFDWRKFAGNKRSLYFLLLHLKDVISDEPTLSWKLLKLRTKVNIDSYPLDDESRSGWGEEDAE